MPTFLPDIIKPVTYQCAKCGMESSIKEVFSTRKSIFGSEKICFECEQKKMVKDNAVFIGLLFVGVIFFFTFFPNSIFRWAFLLSLLLIVLNIPFIVLHELAHASVGWLFDFRVFSIHLGIGKVFYTVRLMGVEWVLHILPLGGLTMLASGNQRHYRLRAFLMILAGPAVHLLVLVPMLLMRKFILPDTSNQIGFVLYYIVIAINALSLIINLFPYQSTSALGPSRSDGLSLLRLPFIPEHELRTQHYAAYYFFGAMEEMEQHNYIRARKWAEKGAALFPESDPLLNMCGVVYSNLNEHEKARQIYLQVLAMSDLSDEIKYVAMSNVAYSNIELEDSSLLVEADAYSEQAFQNASWSPAVLSTRGAVLVELGQVDVGIELLRMAAKKSTSRRSKAMNACAIALAELKRGRLLQAQNYFELARQFDPKCVKLEKVASKLTIVNHS